MGRQYYHFNPVTHRFEVPEPSLKRLLLRYGIPALLAVIISLGIRFSMGTYLNNPKEIKLLAEKEKIVDQYSLVEKKVQQLETALADLQKRDDGLYRCYYGMDPLSKSLREAGLGGAEQYSDLQGYESTPLMMNLNRRVDMAGVKLEVQSGSYNEVLSKAEYQQDLLRHKPSIQPISLQDYYWISSVFGYRTDPMSKKRAMHRGVDFAGREGLNVYATGDGVVIRTRESRTGFGREVLVDHGYGYVTRYGHLKEILVHRGEQIRRGTVIGRVGSTGKSTGPHLHYEVHLYGVSKDPKNYYSDDLKPEEYAKIVSAGESVDN
jgi:murein DD-endopeptidase MepM/ murein hydrolase activator NlpD